MGNPRFTKKFFPFLKSKFYAHLYFSAILEELKNFSPFAEIFLNKVNKKDAPSYYNVIKYPMDLGTMTKKLPYYTLETFINDLNLIWDNCFSFNVGVHYYINCASQMKIKSESLLEYFFSDLGSAKGSTLCIGNNDFVFEPFFKKVETKICQSNGCSYKFVNKILTKLIIIELYSKKIKKCDKSVLDVISQSVFYLVVKELQKMNK